MSIPLGTPVPCFNHDTYVGYVGYVGRRQNLLVRKNNRIYIEARLNIGELSPYSGESSLGQKTTCDRDELVKHHSNKHSNKQGTF